MIQVVCQQPTEELMKLPEEDDYLSQLIKERDTQIAEITLIIQSQRCDLNSQLCAKCKGKIEESKDDYQPLNKLAKALSAVEVEDSSFEETNNYIDNSNNLKES